jgi:hypothetical protein
MRVMVMVKANKDSEAGNLPSRDLLAKMVQFNQELVKAGILLAAEGLQPSSRGTRVRFSAGAPNIFEGPFAEARELISGFWLWQVHSMQEAIEWLKRAPFGGVAEVELRPVMEAENFGTRLTPEMLEQEASLREEINQRKAS